MSTRRGATAAYEGEAELVEQDLTPILHYDPLGPLVRTDLSNGTFSKVVDGSGKSAAPGRSAEHDRSRSHGTAEQARRGDAAPASTA
jgi:hypothetical protein